MTFNQEQIREVPTFSYLLLIFKLQLGRSHFSRGWRCGYRWAGASGREPIGNANDNGQSFCQYGDVAAGKRGRSKQ